MEYIFVTADPKITLITLGESVAKRLSSIRSSEPSRGGRGGITIIKITARWKQL